MEFEEQFPNLKGWPATIKKIKEMVINADTTALVNSLRYPDNYSAGPMPDFSCWEFVPTHIIQKCCLDKQVVKDTIIKYLRGGEFSEEKQWALNRILKELGLSEGK